jgi:polysaccharide export outer membrane protein
MRKLLILIPVFLFFLSSCKLIRSNLLLRTKNSYPYDKLTDSLSNLDYRLSPNDRLQIRVETNDGFQLIDLANKLNIQYRTDLDILVESDGTGKMPMIGYLKLEGFTIREVEKLLEERYTEYYVKPFVVVKVVNRRVIVFPGNGGVAKVLPLANNNTTILEAIALSGGITDDGKAYKVKLIRNYRDKKPEVYLMDLSEIEGLAFANTKVAANDIIYIEPRYRLARTVAAELAPVVSIITSFILIYSVIRIR